MKPKAILFDADGVLTLPEEMFAVMYARTRGLDLQQFEHFFKDVWPAIVTGKKDLKESILEQPKLWQWDGNVDELLKRWFVWEDVQNSELLDLIQALRQQGVLCYLATDQEKYRGEYMRNIMFKDLFDDYFISSELGVAKTDPAFYMAIIKRLSYNSLAPQDIMFFDDSQSKVDTACSVGVNGQLYTGLKKLKQSLGITHD